MKPGNPFILLSVMSAVLASCTDLEYHEYIDLQPDMAAVNAGPAVSLRAEQSPDNMVTVTLNEGDGFTTAGLFARSNAPLSVSRTIQLKAGDEEMVEEYSRNTGVEYTLLPAPFYKFINGSTVDIPEGTAQSATKQLRLFAKNPLDNVLAPGRYLLPVVGTSVLGELADSTVFVDVTVRTPYTDPDGYELYTGEDMFTVFYINTSAFDPRLANDMILQERISSGVYEYKGLGNIVNLRMASVGYDSATGKVFIQPSADLRYVLEHSTERVLPVQESDRKVCVCIEGGGQGIGFCNFTDEQIADFVSSVKRFVDTYGIDGINLWDRNSGYDRAVENGFPEMNRTSYPKLIKALREALGEYKLLTLADYEEPTEYFHDTESMGGIAPGEYLDYAWSGYCDGAEPVQIVDPWHQGIPPVSDLHPRQPVAGLSPKRYGCVHATIYTNYTYAKADVVTEWVANGYNPNGISVYYDIRSQVQDQYETGGCWNPSYIIQNWFDDLVNIGLNIGRLNNVLSENNPSGTKYNKWAKDW
mgnify:CR=1 FL=1